MEVLELELLKVVVVGDVVELVPVESVIVV